MDSSYLGDRSKVWLVGHIRYAFWGVTLLVVVNLFVTKKIVVVKKVGFMAGVLGNGILFYGVYSMYYAVRTYHVYR